MTILSSGYGNLFVTIFELDKRESRCSSQSVDFIYRGLLDAKLSLGYGTRRHLTSGAAMRVSGMRWTTQRRGIHEPPTLQSAETRVSCRVGRGARGRCDGNDRQRRQRRTGSSSRVD